MLVEEARHTFVQGSHTMDLTLRGNKEFYERFLPFAKEHGVKIATENMWNWTKENGLDQAAAAACSHHDNFNAHLDAVNDEFLVACLDIGHAEMRGLGTNSTDMIKALGSRLQALHIHDNEGVEDQHILPFGRGNIDWQDFMDGLKEINYEGIFNFEIPGESKQCPFEVLHAKTKLVKAAYDWLMKM